MLWDISHLAIIYILIYIYINSVAVPSCKLVSKPPTRSTESLEILDTLDISLYRGFLKWGYPNSWMVYFMKTPIKSDDNWGYPHFRKPPYIYHQHPSTTSILILDKLSTSRNLFNPTTLILNLP